MLNGADVVPFGGECLQSWKPRKATMYCQVEFLYSCTDGVNWEYYVSSSGYSLCVL